MKAMMISGLLGDEGYNGTEAGSTMAKTGFASCTLACANCNCVEI